MNLSFLKKPILGAAIFYAPLQSMAWGTEGHRIAGQIAGKLYSETKNGDALNAYKYNFDHIAIVNQQLLEAGVRLAGILNQIFA